MTTWNSPQTAPKDGTVFLGDFGHPYAISTMWCEYSSTWSIATPQICDNDSYFETEQELMADLKRWTPLPAM